MSLQRHRMFFAEMTLITVALVYNIYNRAAQRLERGRERVEPIIIVIMIMTRYNSVPWRKEQTTSEKLRYMTKSVKILWINGKDSLTKKEKGEEKNIIREK